METVQRYSRKREAILSALLSSREHPSAEMLYNALKGQYPDLSLGTVYRNLSQFRESGRAACVATVAGQERFDGNTAPHVHFICDRCGSVYDVDTPEPVLAPAVPLPGTVRECSLTIYGMCNHCT